MSLRETRKNCKLTQEEAAKLCGVSLRTYVSYEKDEEKADQLKLERMKQVLETNGMNLANNTTLVNAMFDCAKKHVMNTK